MTPENPPWSPNSSNAEEIADLFFWQPGMALRLPRRDTGKTCRKEMARVTCGLTWPEVLREEEGGLRK